MFNAAMLVLAVILLVINLVTLLAYLCLSLNMLGSIKSERKPSGKPTAELIGLSDWRKTYGKSRGIR